MPGDVQEMAVRLLEWLPGVVARWWLLRDVLKEPPDSPEMLSAYHMLDQSRWVIELTQEQWGDGSWGAFHSRNTKRKQCILTTEMGVERALSLGLESDHPVLVRASAYLLRLMCGEITFPDYHEKNDRWPIGMRLFIASTFSLFQPKHSVLETDRVLWLEIARRTFHSGVYSEADEIRAHIELTGVNIQGSYLVINGKYQLNLLGSIPGALPRAVEEALLRWLWDLPNGLGYLSVPLNQPPETKPGQIDRWLASLELLARCFPTWLTVARPAIDWIWAQRNPDGWWDFGPLPYGSACLPFSESWRDHQARQIDWSVRVLILLKHAQEAGYLYGQ